MFEIYVDFDEIRERAVDGIFAVAGQVANLFEEATFAVEDFVDRVNDAAE